MRELPQLVYDWPALLALTIPFSLAGTISFPAARPVKMKTLLVSFRKLSLHSLNQKSIFVSMEMNIVPGSTSSSVYLVSLVCSQRKIDGSRSIT